MTSGALPSHSFPFWAHPVPRRRARKWGVSCLCPTLKGDPLSGLLTQGRCLREDGPRSSRQRSHVRQVWSLQRKADGFFWSQPGVITHQMSSLNK